jgi:hypothetical protein
MIGVPDYCANKKRIKKENKGSQRDFPLSRKTIQIDVDKEFKNQPSCNEIKENDEE